MPTPRTNAGMDNIATFRKLHVFEKPGFCAMGIATAGNLAVTQSALTLASEGMKNPDTGALETLTDMPSMFAAAKFLGRAVREAREEIGETIEQEDTSAFNVSLLFGGQVTGGRLRLFMIYAAGNFIEATPDTPYLQIGEHKYGKPILDRSVTESTTLDEALKLGLISMDSTIRSNLSVGLPIDLLTIRRDTERIELSYRVEAAEPYFHDLRERWSGGIARRPQSHPLAALQIAMSARVALVTGGGSGIGRATAPRPCPCRICNRGRRTAARTAGGGRA